MRPLLIISAIAITASTSAYSAISNSSSSALQQPSRPLNIEQQHLNMDRSQIQEHQQSQKDSQHIDIPGQTTLKSNELRQRDQIQQNQRNVRNQERNKSTAMRQDETSPLQQPE